MDGMSAPQGTSLNSQVNLQTLNSILQQSVQAQNLIATNLDNLSTAFIEAFSPSISSSATWDPISLITASSTLTIVSAAGAVLGNFSQASFSLDLQGLSLSSYVSSADVVTVVLTNNTGSTINLGSGTLRIKVTTV